MNQSWHSSLQSFVIPIWTLVGGRTHPHPLVGSQHEAIQRKALGWHLPSAVALGSGVRGWSACPACCVVPGKHTSAGSPGCCCFFAGWWGSWQLKCCSPHPPLLPRLPPRRPPAHLPPLPGSAGAAGCLGAPGHEAAAAGSAGGLGVHRDRVGCSRRQVSLTACLHTALLSPGHCKWHPPSHGTMPGHWSGMCRPPPRCGTRSGG